MQVGRWEDGGCSVLRQEVRRVERVAFFDLSKVKDCWHQHQHQAPVLPVQRTRLAPPPARRLPPPSSEARCVPPGRHPSSRWPAAACPCAWAGRRHPTTAPTPKRTRTGPFTAWTSAGDSRIPASVLFHPACLVTPRAWATGHKKNASRQPTAARLLLAARVRAASGRSLQVADELTLP